MSENSFQEPRPNRDDVDPSVLANGNDGVTKDRPYPNECDARHHLIREVEVFDTLTPTISQVGSKPSKMSFNRSF